MGNTFAQEIIKILDKVITEEMKKKLAEEFVYDKTVPVKDRTLNIHEVFGYEEFIQAIKMSMIKTIKNTKDNENSRNQLIENQQKFEGKGNSI